MRARSALGLLFFASGCLTFGGGGGGGDTEPDPDTQELGVYDVVGALDSDCGAGKVTFADPWNFAAELARSKTSDKFYWDVGTGRDTGSLDEEKKTFTLEASTSSTLRDAGDDGKAACVIKRTDHLDGELDDVDHPTKFEGKFTFSYEATPGSDCTDFLLGPDRVLSRLPCKAHYDLEATRRPEEGGAGGSAGAGGEGGEAGAGGDAGAGG